MTTSIECVECGSSFVVNKKYKLCKRHNYERLHQGKGPRQVYSEKSKSLETNKLSSHKSKLKSVSNTNHYQCSDGSTITKAEIHKNYKQTCNEILLEREQVCQGTGRTDLPLSFSHTISRKRCQQLGKSELIWDKANIELESFEEPCSNPTTSHNIWEVGSLEMKKKLLNFTRKLEYIKIHDSQTYVRLTVIDR